MLGTDLMTSVSVLQPFLAKLEKNSVLSDEDRATVLALPHTVRHVPSGQTLVHEAGEPTQCFAVITGIVGRVKVLPDGSRQIVSVHVAGEGIDLHKFVSPEASHSVVSLARAQVAVFRVRDLERLFDRPSLRAAIWREILFDAAIQREWTLNVGRRNARTRLAHFMCEMGWRLTNSGVGPDDSYVINLTQEHLADIAGLTTVHVNRTLQSLKEQGAIGRTARPLSVPNPALLKTIAAFEDSYLHVAA